jgi:hypothetical protein
MTRGDRWVAESLSDELNSLQTRYRDMITRFNSVDPEEHRKLTAAHEEAKKASQVGQSPGQRLSIAVAAVTDPWPSRAVPAPD